MPRGTILAADDQLNLLVLRRDGSIARRLPSWHPPKTFGLYGLEVSSDRRHALASLDNGNDRLPARLYEIDLATGRSHRVADALAPALSPDGKRLLYIANTYPADHDYPLLTAAVITTVKGAPERRPIPFESRPTIGTPPDLVTNWSPDGRHVVVRALDGFRIVDVDHASAVDPEPRVPGTAPAFLDARTLVVLVDCCIGRQHLARFDLQTRKQAAFAEISSPVESIRRLDSSRVVVVTALHELAIVRRGHARVIARHMVAAAL